MKKDFNNVMDLYKIQKKIFKIIIIPLFIISISGIFLMVKGLFNFVDVQPKTSDHQPYSGIVPFTDLEFHTGRRFPEFEAVIFRPNEFTLFIQMIDGEKVQIHPQSGYVLNRGKSLVPFLTKAHNGRLFGGSIVQYSIFLLVSLLFLAYLVISFIIMLRERKAAQDLPPIP